MLCQKNIHIKYIAYLREQHNTHYTVAKCKNSQSQKMKKKKKTSEFNYKTKLMWMFLLWKKKIQFFHCMCIYKDYWIFSFYYIYTFLNMICIMKNITLRLYWLMYNEYMLYGVLNYILRYYYKIRRQR